MASGSILSLRWTENVATNVTEPGLPSQGTCAICQQMTLLQAIVEAMHATDTKKKVYCHVCRSCFPKITELRLEGKCVVCGKDGPTQHSKITCFTGCHGFQHVQIACSQTCYKALLPKPENLTLAQGGIL